MVPIIYRPGHVTPHANWASVRVRQAGGPRRLNLASFGTERIFRLTTYRGSGSRLVTTHVPQIHPPLPPMGN